LRTVTTQYQEFYVATQSFKQKYFALPGDMTNATQFWGAVAAAGPVCRTTPSTDKKTCDGDGNGQVEQNTGSVEYWRFWQHLANAGLISGSYSGTLTAPQSPQAKIPGYVQWQFIYIFGANSRRFLIDYGNTYYLAVRSGSGLQAHEVWNIDGKLDDGKPATGKVVVYSNPNLAQCTDAASDTDFTASYLLSSSGGGCALIWRQQF